MPCLSVQCLKSKIRYAEEPDNPTLITTWLQQDRCCDLGSGFGCDFCFRGHQRRHYEAQFRLLLDTVVDEILPSHWRCACLDQIYRPLSNLGRLCDSPQSEQHLKSLFNELAVTGRYVQSGLCD